MKEPFVTTQELDVPVGVKHVPVPENVPDAVLESVETTTEPDVSVQMNWKLPDPLAELVPTSKKTVLHTAAEQFGLMV